VANLYGMIEEMDFHVGRLMDHLEENGLSENTLVIFMSDNGPWFSCTRHGSMLKNEWRVRNPSEHKGFKGRVWQNGVKSPLFIKYGRSFAPATVDSFVDMTDLFPFILDFADLKKPEGSPPLDGESFLAALKGEPFQRSGIAFYGTHDLHPNRPNFNQWTPFDEEAKASIRFQDQFLAVRDYRYKLILNPISDKPCYPEPINRFVLFDMREDPQETVNLYSALPKISDRLQTQMRRRFDEILGSEGSLRPPIYLVEGNISVVNAYGPSSSGGAVISKANDLSNFRRPGDRAEYDLRVAEAGRYTILLDKRCHAGSGFQFKVQVGEESFLILLNEDPLQTLGAISLPAGEVKMTFEMVARQSINPWESLDTLHRFYVVAEETNFQAEKLSVPK
jgi:hypothetical protein